MIQIIWNKINNRSKTAKNNMTKSKNIWLQNDFVDS